MLGTSSTTSQALEYYYKPNGGSETLLYTSTAASGVTGYFGMHSSIDGLEVNFSETGGIMKWTIVTVPSTIGNGSDTWFHFTNPDDYYGYTPSMFRITIDGTSQGAFGFRIYENNDWNCTSSTGCGSMSSKYSNSDNYLNAGDEFYVKYTASGPEPGTGSTMLPPEPITMRFY